jgi:hypothetical protein
MFYGVLGPIVDVLWDIWPGTGACVLLTSQYVFVLHTWGSWASSVECAVMIITMVGVGLSWLFHRRIYYEFYPGAKPIMA